MRHKELMWKVAVVLLLCMPSVARSGEVEDLKTAVEQYVGAVSTRNLEALMALVHDEAVIYFPTIPFPSDGKAAIRQAYQSTFTNHESITLRPINPQYRVLGPIGLAWGHLSLTRKPKDGPLTTVFTRYSWTFGKVDGKWVLVTGHASPITGGGSTGN
jgi:ketosteroid isomerase-like protein